jgi:uncharacterized protein (TIGR03032 family)
MMPGLSEQHTAEVTNLAAVNDRAHFSFDPRLMQYETEGAFWETLQRLGLTLVVTREYEHFALLMGAPDGRPLQSPLPLPHPSGIAVDPSSGHLIVSSTRTPNLIFWLRALNDADWLREIVPPQVERPAGSLYLPFRTTLLPGSLYIHEIAMIGGELFATVTGHNFVARLNPEGGWERVWWPKLLDGIEGAFRQNFFQLNGMAAGASLGDSYFTAFSDLTGGPKPWKQGYGPKEKGVVFSGATRDVVARGLTCPHSPRRREDDLWLCNSGFGELSCIKGVAAGEEEAQAVARLPGFTRGLAFAGHLAFVGLSRVIASYEAYAPGVPAATSCCGVAIVDICTGAIVGRLSWPEGYQVFDIQVLPEVPEARFPFDPEIRGEINAQLRYLG